MTFTLIWCKCYLMFNSPLLPNSWRELNGVATSGSCIRLLNVPSNVSAVAMAAEWGMLSMGRMVVGLFCRDVRTGDVFGGTDEWFIILGQGIFSGYGRGVGRCRFGMDGVLGYGRATVRGMLDI